MRSLIRDRRASVSVELALVSAFFLIPLTLGVWDGVYALVARYQTEAALHTLYYFAWSDPGDAADSQAVQTLLGAIDKTAIAPIHLAPAWPQTPPPECLQPDGTGTPAAADGTCSSGTPETMVAYRLVTTVELPFAIPGFANPATIIVGGAVRIQ